MKVLCINNGVWLDILGRKVTGPSSLETCTVTGNDKYKHYDGYFLAEYPGDSFLSSEFIPVTEQEEEQSAEIELLELTKS